MVGGPYFEDFEVGRRFGAPGLTLTEGHAAMHQALTGDRLALALDAELSGEVTGVDRPLAHPNLVCDVAIGQSTGPTQRVLGNLFYRGLVLLRPVFVGDTLRTHTEIVGLKQNQRKEKAAVATGLVALRVSTVNQHGDDVLDYFRCPMIPCATSRRRPATPTASTTSPPSWTQTGCWGRCPPAGTSIRSGRLCPRASRRWSWCPAAPTRWRGATP